MNSDPNKRQVQIFNTKTGETRLSEPVPVQIPRAATDAIAPSAATPNDVLATPEQSPEQADASGGADTAETSHSVNATSDAATAANHAGIPDRNRAVGKQKASIETLEQFIAYAYSRKGQRVTLKPKTERLIERSAQLDDGALSRLYALADGDALLAVPRQLLLVGREVEGSQGLRAALNSFVSGVMSHHPAFVDSRVQAALRNLPASPAPAEALALVAGHKPASALGKDSLKPADLQALRRNAAHLLATSMAINRGWNTEELASLLFQALWAPAARDLFDDNARLRALTEVEQPAGVGLACHRFRQQAIEARTAQEQSQREAAVSRAQAAELEALQKRTEEERDAALAELQALREGTVAELADLRSRHEVERTHLRHDHEQLQGRLVRRLTDSAEMLEVGLKALQNKTPRTEVMVERAEHVIDALRAEATNLKAE